MIAPQVSSFKYLQSENLRELAQCSGFCMTAVVPPFVPGEKSRYSPSTLLRNFTHEAEIRLTELRAAKAQIQSLLDPLAKLAADPALAEGFHWSRAILRSPELFEEFILRRAVPGRVTVAQHFQLLAFAAEAELPREFYVLKLSKKRAILERAGTRLEHVTMPKIAETLDQFLELEMPDHDRENRSAVGGATGAQRRVRFGTGSEREGQSAYLGDYYRHIDQGIGALLRGRNAPVVLAGVEADTALFRSVAAYPAVLGEAIAGSPDNGTTDEEMLERGVALVRADVLRRNREALAAAKERMAPARFSEDPAEMLKLAEAGRVGQFYVAEDAGNDPEKNEKLNRVMIETLKHAGEVHALPAGSAPGVLLRY